MQTIDNQIEIIQQKEELPLPIFAQAYATLRKNSMLDHLISSLERGENIEHYGRLVFVIVARYFLPVGEIVRLLTQDATSNFISEREALNLVNQVISKDYNPPVRSKEICLGLYLPNILTLQKFLLFFLLVFFFFFFYRRDIEFFNGKLTKSFPSVQTSRIPIPQMFTRTSPFLLTSIITSSTTTMRNRDKCKSKRTA